MLRPTPAKCSDPRPPAADHPTGGARPRSVTALALALATTAATFGTTFGPLPAAAQDFFRPPRATDAQRAPRNTANIDRPQQTDGWSQRTTPEPQVIAPPPSDTLPLDRKSRAVETFDLAPVMAADGSSLPHELWLGLDVAEIEKLIGSLSIPPRSPALHGLWKRLVTASVGAPLGDPTGGHFEALRLEALYRSGLLQEIDDALKGAQDPGTGPLAAMLVARAEIGLGRREAGCERARGLSNINRDIPKSLRGEAVLVSGYCAAAEGNAAAAGLLAELAREEGITTSPGLAALDQIAVGAKPTAPKPSVTSSTTQT